MRITRNSLDTNPGPSDWFTGTVYIDPIAAPAATARTGAALVHFTPGARTAWHTHPYATMNERLSNPYARQTRFHEGSVVWPDRSAPLRTSASGPRPTGAGASG